MASSDRQEIHAAPPTDDSRPLSEPWHVMDPIMGLAGRGKTTLITEFAHRFPAHSSPVEETFPIMGSCTGTIDATGKVTIDQRTDDDGDRRASELRLVSRRLFFKMVYCRTLPTAPASVSIAAAPHASPGVLP